MTVPPASGFTVSLTGVWLFRFLNERLIDGARLCLFFFQTHHLMTRGFTPSRHVFF